MGNQWTEAWGWHVKIKKCALTYFNHQKWADTFFRIKNLDLTWFDQRWSLQGSCRRFSEIHPVGAPLQWGTPRPRPRPNGLRFDPELDAVGYISKDIPMKGMLGVLRPFHRETTQFYWTPRPSKGNTQGSPWPSDGLQDIHFGIFSCS